MLQTEDLDFEENIMIGGDFNCLLDPKLDKKGGVKVPIDCKTVRIFAYSSTREQSIKRSGTRLKTESETGERGCVRLARFARARLLRHALPISLLILGKNQTVLQSLVPRKMVIDNIECLQNELDLVDVWRIKNPQSRSYTWSQKSPPIFCCLD